MDQGSNKNHSPAYNFAPTVTKFCVMWEGQALPHDTKFGNCRCKIVDSRAFPSWSLIHGLRWSGLIKAEPGVPQLNVMVVILEWRQGVANHRLFDCSFNSFLGLPTTGTSKLCITEGDSTGPTFIKPDQRNPWIKDQIKITLLPTISHLLLPNFVSCGRDKPSHMTQNLVTVGAKLWTAERFLVDPWSMDYADPVW